MSSAPRSTSYSHEEDVHLCYVYLDISQDPMVGINQSRDQFWSRVENGYNTTLPSFITITQPKRSLMKRMQVINAAVSKMQGCVRQVELLNPSGASDEDIMF